MNMGRGAFPVAQMVKSLPAMWETPFDPWVAQISWRRKMATHSSTLAMDRGAW